MDGESRREQIGGFYLLFGGRGQGIGDTRWQIDLFPIFLSCNKGFVRMSLTSVMRLRLAATIKASESSIAHAFSTL